MKTIKNFGVYELTIKNSKFITLLYKINKEQEVKENLTKAKLNYPDANHYCYAYIVNNKKKSSDDGEPGGTAGVPLMKVLEQNDLTNILVIVIRYFGGIKLGANGLVRAYTKSLTTALDQNTIVTLLQGLNIDITFNYNRIKEIDYLLKDIKINTKDFDLQIKYNLDIKESFLETIKNNNITYHINNHILIEE